MHGNSNIKKGTTTVRSHRYLKTPPVRAVGYYTLDTFNDSELQNH